MEYSTNCPISAIFNMEDFHWTMKIYSANSYANWLFGRSICIQILLQKLFPLFSSHSPPFLFSFSLSMQVCSEKRNFIFPVGLYDDKRKNRPPDRTRSFLFYWFSKMSNERILIFVDSVTNVSLFGAGGQYGYLLIPQKEI